jgi:membrane-associated phospholipid phosphatase
MRAIGAGEGGAEPLPARRRRANDRSLLGAAPALGRLLLVLGVLVFFLGGYFGVASAVDPLEARSLRTALDDRIPFIADSVFVYALVYIGMLFPVFVVRCPRLLRRVAVAYVVTIAVGLICFALLPVTSVGLRPEIQDSRPDRFALWGIKTLYALDPPVDLFPSLHLAIAVPAALSARKARAIYAGVPFLVVAAVAVSTCTVKQHFWVDAVGGILLALVTYTLVVRPHFGSPPQESAYTWRGASLYLGLALLVYLGLHAAYRVGLEPWR